MAKSLQRGDILNTKFLSQSPLIVILDIKISRFLMSSRIAVKFRDFLV